MSCLVLAWRVLAWCAPVPVPAGGRFFADFGRRKDVLGFRRFFRGHGVCCTLPQVRPVRAPPVGVGG